jgi:hypothetical protein
VRTSAPAPTEITPTQQSAARIAALAFPVSLGLLAYANFGIRADMFAGADWAESVRRISAGASAFRFSIAFDLAYCAGFLILTSALYTVLRPVNRRVALLASFAKLLYVVSAMLMALSFLRMLRIATEPAYTSALGIPVQHMTLKLMHGGMWDEYYIGLVFWASASTLFSWLWLKSRYVPAPLAGFGIVASAWCAFCAVAHTASSQFPTVVNVWLYDMPMVMFYLVLSIWLGLKGLGTATKPVEQP